MMHWAKKTVWLGRSLMALGMLALGATSVWAAPFSFLDRQDKGFQLGFQSDLSLILDGDITVSRNEVFGHFARDGWGGYAAFPFTHTMIPNDDDVTRAGNLELGAFHYWGSQMGGIATRLGVVLPTGGNDPLAYAGGWGRITDQALSVPLDTALRLSASPKVDLGLVVVRGDLGVDFVFDDGEYRAFLRTNAALAVRAGLVIASLEYTGIGDLRADDISDSYRHLVGATARIGTPFVKPFVSLGLPFSETSEVGDAFVATLGVVFEG